MLSRREGKDWVWHRAWVIVGALCIVLAVGALVADLVTRPTDSKDKAATPTSAPIKPLPLAAAGEGNHSLQWLHAMLGGNDAELAKLEPNQPDYDAQVAASFQRLVDGLIIIAFPKAATLEETQLAVAAHAVSTTADALAHHEPGATIQQLDAAKLKFRQAVDVLEAKLVALGLKP